MIEPPTSLFRPGVVARLVWPRNSMPAPLVPAGTPALPAELER
jgi:hypothetical protein